MLEEAIAILLIILILVNLISYVKSKSSTITHEEYFDSISKIPKSKISDLSTIKIKHIDKPTDTTSIPSYVDDIVTPKLEEAVVSNDPVTNMINDYFSGTKLPNDIDTELYDKKRDALFEVEMEAVESKPGQKSKKQSNIESYNTQRDGYRNL